MLGEEVAEHGLGQAQQRDPPCTRRAGPRLHGGRPQAAVRADNGDTCSLASTLAMDGTGTASEDECGQGA